MAVRWYRRMIEDSFEHGRLNKVIPSMIIAAAVLLFVSAMLVIFSGNTSVYTPITDKCILCHNDTGYPADTDNDSISAPYKRPHNNTIMCETCHGQDPHNLTFIQQNGTYGVRSLSAGCPDCHIFTILKENNNNFSTAPMIPALRHSSNPANGTIWGTYWDTSSNSSSPCDYCHGETKHNTSALGLISNLMLDENNTLNSSIFNTTWCADCHLNGSNTNYRGNMWSPAPPLITVNNTGNAGWVNHSTYFGSGNKDSDCRPCHILNGSSYALTSLNYSHSLDPGTSGPDCLSCHDTGRSAARRINNSAMNGINSVHRNLNSNAVNSSWVSAQNKKCWGCHDSTGTQPSNDSMGNRYKDPYKCYDCHNLSELQVIYTEDDSYNTNFSLSSHYGRNRPDLRTWNGTQTVNCSYCHQNTSSAFLSAMVNPTSNSSIQNHSQNFISPDCFNSTCHSIGWIHNSTLTRPVLPLPNTTYCQNCHSQRQEHNGSVTCTNCHRTQFSNFPKVPIIPDFTHSNSPSSGRKWGEYWDNSSMITACYFCHRTEVHNASILGNVSLIKGSNIFNDPNLINSSWCAACHYNNSPDYKGYLINPKPPEILNWSGKVPSNASEGTTFYNHSDIGNFNDSHCLNCHGSLLSGYLETSLNFSHRVSIGGGGKDCISCHNKSGTGAPINLRVDVSAIKTYI